jgi:hypothetical protein
MSDFHDFIAQFPYTRQLNLPSLSLNNFILPSPLSRLCLLPLTLTQTPPLHLRREQTSNLPSLRIRPNKIITRNPALASYLPPTSLNKFRPRQQSLHRKSARSIPLAEFLGYATTYLFDYFFLVEETYFAFGGVDIDVDAVGFDEYG